MQSCLSSLFSRIFILLTIFLAGKSLAQSPQLQIVTELSPPYQTLINNEVSGSATEKVKSILLASNLSASFQIYPWARAYNKAITEPNTLIYSIANTTERDDLFHWLLPIVHYKFGLVALSNNKTANITELKDVANFVLAVQRNDIAHQWALNYGLEEGNQLIVCSDIGCSWQLLLNKKVDFIVESPELIENMLQQYTLPTTLVNYVIAIPELELSGYLAANKKTDPDILEKLKLAIKNQ